MKIPLTENLEKLPLPATEKWPDGVWDIEAFKHGTMSIVLFAPEGNDYQTPHEQDELYIVIEGSGILDIEGTQIEFAKGDALFVPALKAHKFVEFTQGIQMWAIFWGEKGGEYSSYHESQTGEVACGGEYSSYHKSRTGKICFGGLYQPK